MSRKEAGTAMRLWSIQSSENYATLLRSRRLYGRFPSATYYPENHIVAYKWMAEQLAQHLGAVEPIPPIWAWHAWSRVKGNEKPPLDVREHYPIGHDAVCLELSIPSCLVLLSQTELWEYVLIGEPVYADYAEMEEFDRMASSGVLDRKAVVDTWPRIFDLTFGLEEIVGPYGERSIQGCLPYIDIAFVQCVECLADL